MMKQHFEIVDGQTSDATPWRKLIEPISIPTNIWKWKILLWSRDRTVRAPVVLTCSGWGPGGRAPGRHIFFPKQVYLKTSYCETSWPDGINSFIYYMAKIMQELYSNPRAPRPLLLTVFEPTRPTTLASAVSSLLHWATTSRCKTNVKLLLSSCACTHEYSWPY